MISLYNQSRQNSPGSAQDEPRLGPGYFKGHSKPIGHSPYLLKEMVVEIQETMYDMVFKKSLRGKTIITKK